MIPRTEKKFARQLKGYEAIAFKALLMFQLVFLPDAVLAQQKHVQFEHLTVENGLAHNRVWRIMQDSKGFLWFATGYGLSRYDGYTFTNFRQGSAGSLSHDAIWAVFEDHAGTIWAGTYGGGLNKFDAATQTFRHFLHDPENPNSLSNNIVRDIIELSNEPGVLWIATIGGGLNRFDTRTETFTHFQYDPNDPGSLPHNSVHVLCETRDGELWLGTGDGFSQLVRPGNSKSNRLDSMSSSEPIRFHNEPFKPGKLTNLYGSGVTALIESKDGALWLGGNTGGLSRFDRKTGSYFHYLHDPDDPNSLGDGSVRSIFEDDAGIIWIGLRDGGLNRLDRKAQTFERYNHNPDNPVSLSHEVVRDIFQDRSGVIWIATFGGGVNKVAKKRFELFRHEINNPNSLLRNNVSSIAEDANGHIWVGMHGAGLTRLTFSEKNNVSYSHYVHDPANPNSLSSNFFRRPAHWETLPDYIWVSTFHHGFNRLDVNTGEVVRYQHQSANANSLSSNVIASIHQSLQNPEVLWIAAENGRLNRFDTHKNRFSHFDLGTANLLTRIYESPHLPGILWVGTIGSGVIRFDTESGAAFHALPEDTISNLPAHIEEIHESPKRPGILWAWTDRDGFFKIISVNSINDLKIKHFSHIAEKPNSLISDKLWAFFETDDGTFWFGSEKGLSRFDPETEKFGNYTTLQGLPSNFVQSILADDRGNLWVATNAGLSKFDPTTEKFRNFSVGDGLQGEAFQPNAFAKDRNSRLYFGGLNGLNIFHPDSIKEYRYVPAVVITDFRIFNKPVKIDPQKPDEDQTLPAHFSTLKKIVLSYHENVFSFEFAALDYTAPEQNLYAYLLEGFHSDWIEAGNNRVASFTNLSPGEYTFHVRGSNHDGIWNEEGTSVKIIILPPWWRTWWAYSLYGLGILFGLLLLWRYESNRQKHKHKAHLRQMEARKLQEVDYLKSTFFANISHEIRTPLTLIIGQVESELRSKDEKKNRSKLQMALRNAKQLLRLINQLLDLSKLEAGGMTLNAKPQNIVPLLKSLTASFESLAQPKKIDLRFGCAHNSIIVNYEQDKIEKIIYNLLSNALKFTPDGGTVAVTVAGGSSAGEKGSGSERELFTENTPAPQHPRSPAPMLRISVRDSGIGIPKDRLPHIFDRFYQVDSAKTREHEGTGIGLALTKELVELHGGTISAESNEGFGTVFTVQMPVVSFQRSAFSDQLSEDSDQLELMEEDIPPTPFKGGVDLVSPLEGGIRGMSEQLTAKHQQPKTNLDIILIIEDNADVRAYVRQTLEENYRIIEAKDGEEGMKSAQEYIPDLIISDVMMPKMDGYELTRRLRTDQLTSHIPIIMLTAKAAEDEKLEGLETGADAYLIKPFSSKELQVRVRKLIESRRQLRKQTGSKVLITPSAIQTTSMDQEFLQSVRKAIEAHFEDENFSVDDLAAKVGMGKRQLQRKLKALTDTSPQQCIRSMRLQRARQLLEQKAGTVSEIAFQVGYGDVTAFSKAFRTEFGVAPSEIFPGKST